MGWKSPAPSVWIVCVRLEWLAMGRDLGGSAPHRWRPYNGPRRRKEERVAGGPDIASATPPCSAALRRCPSLRDAEDCEGVARRAHPLAVVEGHSWLLIIVNVSLFASLPYG